MDRFLPSPLQIELLVLSLAFIILGLSGIGFFTSSDYRWQRKAGLVFCLTALLILLLVVATAGIWNPKLMEGEGFLIQPAISWGRYLQRWIPHYSEFIKRSVLILIVLITPLLLKLKKKSALPLLLLLFAGGASLTGGLYLSHGQTTWGIRFLGLACLYAWFCGLISRKTAFLRPPDLLPGMKSYILLALIVLLGFLLRNYDLGQVSFRFDHHEADYAREALKVLGGKHSVNFWTNTNWRGLGHHNYSPVYTYCVALFFRVFGPTMVSLKLVPVTWGVLALLLTYGIFKILFGKRLALITTFFLAVSPLHINYSRIGLLLCSTQTVSFLIIYLLLRVIILRRFLSYIFLGIAVSFAGYFYSPGKYPVLISAFLIAVYSLFKRRFLLRNFPGILLLILTVLIITSAFNLPTWDLMAPRFAGYESVWHRTRSHVFTPKADYIRALPLIWENLTKLIHTFFFNLNFNYNPWPCGHLFFNPVIPVMTLFGIAYSLANIKKANYRLLLFFTVAFLLPNLLSRPPAVVRRMMVSWPFIYCLAAIPVSQLLKKTSELFGKVSHALVTLLVIAGLLSVGAYNCHIFFDSNQPAGRWEVERYFDEYSKSLLDDYYLYLVPYSQYSRKTIDFILGEKMAPGKKKEHFQYLRAEQIRNFTKEELPSGRPVAFVCVPDHIRRADLENLKDRLGGGRLDTFRNKFGRVIAHTLFVKADRPSSN